MSLTACIASWDWISACDASDVSMDQKASLLRHTHEQKNGSDFPFETQRYRLPFHPPPCEEGVAVCCVNDRKHPFLPGLQMLPTLLFLFSSFIVCFQGESGCFAGEWLRVKVRDKFSLWYG